MAEISYIYRVCSQHGKPPQWRLSPEATMQLTVSSGHISTRRRLLPVNVDFVAFSALNYYQYTFLLYLQLARTAYVHLLWGASGHI